MRPGIAIALAALGALAMFGREAPAQAQATRSLTPPWNLVTAGQTIDLDDLAAELPALEAVYRWDPDTDAFDAWRRDAPAFLNALTRINEGDGVWVRVTQALDWPLPGVAAVSLPATAAGWHLIGWSEISAASEDVRSRLNATRIIGWDAAAQVFRTHDPVLPTSQFPTVAFSDAIWAFLGGGEPSEIELIPALGGRVFEQPIELGPYPNNRVFVAEQRGDVRVYDLDGDEHSVLLDLRPQVTYQGERGLLSFAIDPSFAMNDRVYAYYSPLGQTKTRLSRFTVSGDVASTASEVVILEIEQPFANHNGGAIRFGPDGFLYLGLGDGGSGGDPLGAGQDRGTLLGALIRIDVSWSGPGYAVPADNPFTSTLGVEPEIWAYGLRNPWRMAFDPETGELWLADVGQNEVEEVDVIERGGNYGWNILEGGDCFLPASGCDASGTVLPVATYGHNEGCSISGGVVYRGGEVPEIAGAYLFGDFCSGTIWALNAAARGERIEVGQAFSNIASFGVDAAGEVYVLIFGGAIQQIVSP